MEPKKGFTVTINARDCPFSTFQEFKKFATQYAGDTYWVALQLLLERSKRLELHEGAYVVEEEPVQEEPEPVKVVGLSGLTEKE